MTTINKAKLELMERALKKMGGRVVADKNSYRLALFENRLVWSAERTGHYEFKFFPEPELLEPVT